MDVGIQASGFRLWGLGLSVGGVAEGFRVQGSDFRAAEAVIIRDCKIVAAYSLRGRTSRADVEDRPIVSISLIK